ncbi:ATP-binding protein [Streptomyces sp. NPDC019396]|uniref:ATP-binding protein n=1 Tax=Streptomyces sp. NPDC019396 TaxID=3154687 RepID=UPI0033D6EC14
MTLQLNPAHAGEELLLDTHFSAGDLAKLRLRVDELAAIAGFIEPRRAEFVLAMHEVACNAVRHGGGSGTLRLYLTPDALRCQVTDEGPGFDEDVIPCVPPALEASESGRGLWLVRQFTDHMTIVKSSVGTDVTYAMRLSAT